MVSTKRWYGLIVDPNAAAMCCARSPDPGYGLPDDAAALSGSGHDRTI